MTAAPASESPIAAWDLLLGRMSGPAFVVDGGSRILYSNGAASRMDGVRGRLLADFVSETDRDALQRGIADAIQGHAAAVGFALADKTGMRWYRAEVAPLDPQSAVVVATDVTSQHALEEHLRRAEQLMVDTEGITHFGTWTWDVTQPHAQWSAELFRIYGLDPATHKPSYEDYLTRIHPDDVERVKRATEAVFKQHTPYSHDERIRRPDGSWRSLHTWAYPILEDGKLVALGGVCLDVTEQRATEQALHASEARLRALFDHSSFGIAILDPAGRILQANAALCTLARRPAREALGAVFAHCLDEQDRGPFEANLGALIRGLASARRMEAHLARPHPAGTVPVRIDLALVAEPDVAPMLVVIVQDASLREQASESDRIAFARLLELRQMEEKSERRTQLLRVASHEIKNPLTPVMMQLHILQRGMLGALNDKQAHAVQIASKQVNRIANMLRDVLDVARIDQGRLSVKTATVAVEPVVQRVFDAYRPVAEAWDVNLDIGSEAGVWAVADPERLEQVVANLVSNALKFTPAKGLVTVRALEADGGIAIHVADTGPGLDNAQQARIFQPFSQVHQPGQAREEGTGLGLHIARSLVEAMRGRLTVASSAGKGATFTVWLPRAQQAPAAQ